MSIPGIKDADRPAINYYARINELDLPDACDNWLQMTEKEREFWRVRCMLWSLQKNRFRLYSYQST